MDAATVAGIVVTALGTGGIGGVFYRWLAGRLRLVEATLAKERKEHKQEIIDINKRHEVQVEKILTDKNNWFDKWQKEVVLRARAEALVETNSALLKTALRDLHDVKVLLANATGALINDNSETPDFVNEAGQAD